jgi:mono/diheme cytochrome c family protein
MKKLLTVTVICAAILFQYCATSQKPGKAAAAPKITYVQHIEPILIQNCSPCHFPPKGNKEPLNTYAAAKAEIDEILESIRKNPGEKGFMPARHAKLPDSTINAFAKWKADGLLEK